MKISSYHSPLIGPFLSDRPGTWTQKNKLPNRKHFTGSHTQYHRLGKYTDSSLGPGTEMNLLRLVPHNTGVVT